MLQELAVADTPQHDSRRRQILDAARKVFARQGFHSASMQTICAEAKMSPGGVYRYFRSKEEMIAAIAEEQRQHAMSHLSGIWSGERGLAENLLQCTMLYLRDMGNRTESQLCAEVSAERLRNSHIGQLFDDIEGDVKREIFAVFEAARERGEIQPKIELKLVAIGLFAFVDGLAGQLSMDPNLTAEELEPLVRFVIFNFLGERKSA